MSHPVIFKCPAAIICPECGDSIEFEIRFPVTIVTDENDGLQRFESGTPDHDEAPIWLHVMDKHPEWTEATIGSFLASAFEGDDEDGEDQ